MALVTSYKKFFARRKSDIRAVVILLDIGPDNTKIVICRSKNLLFAQLIPIGLEHIAEHGVKKLVLELEGCRRRLGAMYKKARIERMIFLSGKVLDNRVCAEIAEQLQLPAQMADCMAAVKVTDSDNLGVDRRIDNIAINQADKKRSYSWSVAFGLSLGGDIAKDTLLDKGKILQKLKIRKS